MDLKTFALKLKRELQNDPSPVKAQQIANIISNATHNDGTPLSENEKGHILKYIKFPGYDHTTGQTIIHHADNSEFLKLVAIVSNNIKKK